MNTLESVKRKLETAEDLQSVVKTMKAMAAVSIRQYEQAVASLVHYFRAIELGFQVALQGHDFIPVQFSPTEAGQLGAILFGSSQGMCGQFNEQITSYALKQIEQIQPDSARRRLISLGLRTIAHLEDSGQSVEEVFTLPGSISEIKWSVQELLIKIEQWRFDEKVDQIILFFNKKQAGSSYVPTQQFLLPVDLEWLRKLKEKKWDSRSLPMFTLSWEKLFSDLVQHYFFFQLYHAFAESLASENASRLAAMQAAEKNIDEQLNELSDQYNRQRQSAITSELLDIVSGFEALETER